MLVPLPIDAALGAILDAVRARRAAIVVAPPGAGKTTRVPPALALDGPAIVLQPRRVAARSLARRIAEERGWTVGEEVGWQVRFERRFSPRTRLLVATEGVLAARLRSDPLLSAFRTVILDEFHERNLHGDLALALARQAWLARDDLRVVVMSATLDAAPVAEFLGGAPVVEVTARQYPVALDHAPDEAPAAAARRVLARDGGHALCFLPGAPEIERNRDELRRGGVPPGIDVLPLHGSLGADAQDAALAPSARRKLILATNIAETSLTVDGVTDVIDCGLHKVLRLDPGLGLERLEVERIGRDSADQRAGRAGRTGPGRALRLWDPRIELRPHREPEIRRVDLSGAFLDVFAWGGDPRRFEWFEAPPPALAEAALELLERLGAVAQGRITELGRTMRSFALPPRLACLLVSAGGTAEAAAACAMLAEGGSRALGGGRECWDVLELAARIGEAPAGVRQAAQQLADLARALPRREAPEASGGDTALRRAILLAYPDRVARRREPGSRRLLLASGHGAVLPAEGGVFDADYLVAIDLVAGERGPRAEARVRLASPVDADWLCPERRDKAHFLDAGTGTVRAVERGLLGALVLWERPAKPEPEVARDLLADAVLARGLGRDGEHVLERLRFARIDVDVVELVRSACAGRTSIPAVDVVAWLPAALRERLGRLAPATLELPGGRRVRLEYRPDDRVVAAVKLQELFGLTASPVVGQRRTAVTFELLAPNGRPVQTTSDLSSFWAHGYPAVRRELRGRYPKHAWPEDPLNASPPRRGRPR